MLTNLITDWKKVSIWAGILTRWTNWLLVLLFRTVTEDSLSRVLLENGGVLQVEMKYLFNKSSMIIFRIYEGRKKDFLLKYMYFNEKRTPQKLILFWFLKSDLFITVLEKITFYWFTNISQNIRNMDLNFKLILFDCMLVNHRMLDSKIYYITLYSLMTQI